VVLRGRANPRYFRADDLTQLKAVVLFVVQSMCASLSSPPFEADLDEFEQRLTALVDAAEIVTRILDLGKLFQSIVDRACSLLNATSCSLFLVDPIRHELVDELTAFRIPFGRGIVGQTASTKQIINVNSPDSDQRFDRATDIRSGIEAKSILTVPIFNVSGEITGAHRGLDLSRCWA